jgi:integrase
VAGRPREDTAAATAAVRTGTGFAGPAGHLARASPRSNSSFICAAAATTHSFRKTVATLIDEGLSARIGADHLGHSKVSMTQDRYMSRGRVHSEVAALLDRAIKDE